MQLDNCENSKEFDLQEAFELINTTVLAKISKPQSIPQAPPVGEVVGLLTLNKEVEVVVRFLDKITQLTKQEFQSEIEIVARK